MEWSRQQNEALSKAAAWMRIKFAPTFYLAGYAGTGKTTLAMELASMANGRVAFAAYTGKAARVMAQKGCAGASTIHSLIYDSQRDFKTNTFVRELKDPDALSHIDLIVIDECSMVDEEIGRDLLSFGKPILVLGDPAQLPPVKGGGFFTGREPDYMLTEVHRQARDSAIVRLATEIREGAYQPRRRYEDGLRVVEQRILSQEWVTEADIVLVGRNDTRRKYNQRLRELAGMTRPMPCLHEPVICLRNDQQANIMNGQIFTVRDVMFTAGYDSIDLVLTDPDDGSLASTVKVLKDFFLDDVAASKLPFRQIGKTQQLTYGYAITAHKSQGSQWNRVCVFDESAAFREDRARWLYTAVTRAAKDLTLVI